MKLINVRIFPWFSRSVIIQVRMAILKCTFEQCLQSISAINNLIILVENIYISIIYCYIYLYFCQRETKVIVVDTYSLRDAFSVTLFLPPANEVWGKVIFSQACVIPPVH